MYGTRALITNDTVIQTKCTCGGIAYLRAFGITGLQPALVFAAGGLSGNAKAIGEVIWHEVGHSLGLSHDGSAAGPYYAGQGS